MATHLIITNAGNTIKCVYPRSNFATMFSETDHPNKWLDSNVKYALISVDQKALAREIDEAINNIENLDLA